MPLKNIKKDVSLSEKAYLAIHSSILSNELTPGEVLAEEHLAAQLGISRTPIRTALQRLVLEEIAVVQGKNIVVADVTQQDVRNVCAVRTRLEPLSISLIAQAGGLRERQLEFLRLCNDRQQEAAQQGDWNRFLDQDYTFHTTLAQYTGNAFLADMVRRSNLIIRRYHVLARSLPQSGIPASSEHRHIVDAMEAGTYDRAEALLLEHLQQVDRRFFA